MTLRKLRDFDWYGLIQSPYNSGSMSRPQKKADMKQIEK